MNAVAVRYMVISKQDCINSLEQLVQKYSALLTGNLTNDCKTYYQGCLTEAIAALGQVKALVIQ